MAPGLQDKHFPALSQVAQRGLQALQVLLDANFPAGQLAVQFPESRNKFLLQTVHSEAEVQLVQLAPHASQVELLLKVRTGQLYTQVELNSK